MADQLPGQLSVEGELLWRRLVAEGCTPGYAIAAQLRYEALASVWPTSAAYEPPDQQPERHDQ